MSSTMKGLLRGATAWAVVLSSQVVFSSSAQAASSCAGAGYLCLYDNNTNNFGSFSGYNPSWAPYGWDARADWFYNAGTRMSACVYPNHNYGGGGSLIPRGVVAHGTNYGRSNRWTTASKCP